MYKSRIANSSDLTAYNRLLALCVVVKSNKTASDRIQALRESTMLCPAVKPGFLWR